MDSQRSTDYYAILGLSSYASPEEVKRAYRREMRLQGHPDTGGNTERAIALNKAYEILGDPEKRRKYDGSSPDGKSPLDDEDIDAEFTEPSASYDSGSPTGGSRTTTPPNAQAQPSPPPPPPPKADFVITQRGMTAWVDASASSWDRQTNLASFKWSWGDGSSDTLDSVPMASHDYATTGDYTITLTVEDWGMKASIFNSVSFLPAPVIENLIIEVTGYAVSVTKIQFQQPMQGAATTYDWGDGSVASNSARHTYSRSGNYTVTVATSNATGTGTFRKDIYIQAERSGAADLSSIAAIPSGDEYFHQRSTVRDPAPSQSGRNFLGFIVSFITGSITLTIAMHYKHESEEWAQNWSAPGGKQFALALLFFILTALAAIAAFDFLQKAIRGKD